MSGMFEFTARERKGVLYLIPLVIIIALLSVLLVRHKSDDVPEKIESDSVQIFAFDPNTIDLRGLVTLGFTKKEAVGILNFRERGKRFETPYDFADCYQVSLEMFERLKDSIVIDPKYRAKRYSHTRPQFEQSPRAEQTKEIRLFVFDVNEASADDFRAMGFTVRQSAAIVNFRTSRGGFRSIEEFSECYIISPEKYEQLLPYMRIAVAPEPEPAVAAKVIVELNSSDSSSLCTVRGIGAVTAGRIVAYRKMLGGYVRVEQLAEIKGVTESNYETILKEISIDSSKIQKIDVNFALPETMGRHPYIGALTLRKLLKNRQLKGGWVCIEDMVNDKVMTAAQADKLRPYLIFNRFK